MSFGYEIITYGGGETLTLLFNGIAAAVGENNYTTLIRIFAMFSLGWILIESTFKQSFVLNAKWFIGFLLAYNILLVPKVTVHVIDRVRHDQMQAVAYVPWGLAIFASIASQVGDTLTQAAEKTFTLPDDLKYSQTGTVMASSLIKSASEFKITDPDFAKNMREFMQQCVFYDVLLGKYSMQQLYDTQDVWGLITANASPARAFSYIDKSGKGMIKTCKDGIAILNQDWKTELEQASLIYGQRFFPDSTKAKAQMLAFLPVSYQYLTELSQTAAQLMQQNIMANALQQALIGQAATTDASAAIQSYAVTRANEMKRSTYQITGELAGRWLPIMKNVFEAMFYGSFLFLFLVMLLPVGAGLLRGYIMSLFWLQSWAPLYAILNLVMTIDAKRHSLAAVSNGGLTIATMSGLAQVNSVTAALAGYLSMSIPFIAYGIVKGGASAFTHTLPVQ